MPYRRPKHHVDDEDTNPRGRSTDLRGQGTDSDLHHTVGQLMVETLNHRHRIEILESLAKRSQVPASSLPPSGNNRLLPLIRKTVTTTALIIAALISALKELGFLNLH